MAVNPEDGRVVIRGEQRTGRQVEKSESVSILVRLLYGVLDSSWERVVAIGGVEVVGSVEGIGVLWSMEYVTFY